MRRLEERHQRRQRVLVMPFRRTHAHHVAAGDVDVERRVEHGPEPALLAQVAPPLPTAGLVDLVDPVGDLAEPHLLVAVVVAGREQLDSLPQHRLQMPVEMRDRADPVARGDQRVHLVRTAGPDDADLGQVRGRSEVLLLRLVEQRLHDRRISALGIAQLESVGAVLSRPADPFAGLLRVVADRPAVPALGRTRDSRRSAARRSRCGRCAASRSR